MRKTLLLIALLYLTKTGFTQYVYKINADSVVITNHCDTAELIIENRTRNVPGFLFNRGNGRTVFRRALVQLNDSLFLLGGDTLRASMFSLWKKNGIHIYNINTGNVGIGRTAPRVLLDLPGPINIDDSSAYRINYRPVFNISDTITNIYSSLFIGDSSGVGHFGKYLTCVGAGTGKNDDGFYGTFIGYKAGYKNLGYQNTFVGSESGSNNNLPGPNGGNSGNNSFFGASSGFNNKGSFNSLFGEHAGFYNNGDGNVFMGYTSGLGAIGSYNTFTGTNSGFGIRGYGNTSLGYASEYQSVGNHNILIGDSAGRMIFGSENTIIGTKTLAMDSIYSLSINNTTLIGSRIRVANSSISNSTAIGSGAAIIYPNTMVFGDTAVRNWLFNSNALVSTGAAFTVGSNANNGNGAYLTRGGVWTNASDRNKKEHFEPVDNMALLEKIVQLPITSWNYKGAAEQHIGPVAQDFYRLFHLGTDDKTISTIDPSGIALAAIQGLYGQWQEDRQTIISQQTKIDALQAEINSQRQQLGQLSETVNRLQAAMATAK